MTYSESCKSRILPTRSTWSARDTTGPHLKTLTERAALVFTEEMPVRPLRGWTRALRPQHENSGLSRRYGLRGSHAAGGGVRTIVPLPIGRRPSSCTESE